MNIESITHDLKKGLECGFRQEWVTGKTDSGEPFELLSGAGLGNGWIIFQVGEGSKKRSYRAYVSDVIAEFLEFDAVDAPLKAQGAKP